MENERLQEFAAAIQQGSLDTLEQLTAKQPELIRQPTPSGISPLLTALYYRQPEAARWLQVHGAVIGPFEAAALGEQETLAEYLEQQPALLGAYAIDGFTLLGLAAFFGQPGCLRMLLEAGADPNQPANNPTRVAPLHSACAGAQPEVRLEAARLLLAYGANPNSRQQRGFTPLHAAAEAGDVALIQLLLEHGADPAQSDESGQPPIAYAHKQGHSAAVDRIRQAGG